MRLVYRGEDAEKHELLRTVVERLKPGFYSSFEGLLSGGGTGGGGARPSSELLKGMGSYLVKGVERAGFDCALFLHDSMVSEALDAAEGDAPSEPAAWPGGEEKEEEGNKPHLFLPSARRRRLRGHIRGRTAVVLFCVLVLVIGGMIFGYLSRKGARRGIAPPRSEAVGAGGGEVPRPFFVGLEADGLEFASPVLVSCEGKRRDPSSPLPLKIEARWATLEPQKGDFKRASLEKSLNTLERVSGSEVWVTLSLRPGVPEWAKGEGGVPRLDEWEGFVSEVVDVCKGRVTGYEVLWSPGLTVTEEGTSACAVPLDSYPSFFEAALRAIRSGHPEALVGCGSLLSWEGGMEGYERLVSDAGWGAVLEASDCFFLRFPLGLPPDSWGEVYKEVDRMLDRAGRRGARVFGVLSWPHYPPPYSSEGQERALREGLLSLQEEGCEEVWFSANRDPALVGSQFNMLWGLFSSKGRPLPAWDLVRECLGIEGGEG